MARPELLVHISAPSRGVDDRGYKEQLRGLLDFQVSTRHDILTTERPLSPNPLHGVDAKLGGRFIIPLQSSKDDRSPPPKTLKSSRLPVKADVDGRRRSIKRKEYSRAKGESIASVLERLQCDARSPSIQIKRTPGSVKSLVQVNRTPAQLAKSKPSTSINEHFKRRIRKSNHGDHKNSWETPSGFIPDSQPAARLPQCKMSNKSSPTTRASERHQAGALLSSQAQGINHNSAIDIVFDSFQDVTSSQLSRSSAENDKNFEENSGDSESTADQDQHTLLEGNVCMDDYDHPFTSSQSQAGNIYPRHETYEEFLSGERLAPQPPSPHVRETPSSSGQSQGAPIVSPDFNPTTRMIAYLPSTPAIRRGPLINQNAPTPYLISLTSPDGPFPLSRFFRPNVLSSSSLPTSSLLPSLIPAHGHWLIPLRLWPRSNQRTFWDNLKDRIESGDAGYPGAVTALIEDIEGRTGSRRRGVDMVRVGCLVERLKDVWCLLWEASDGWVGRCEGEARFRVRDGEEVKEVVRMQ